MVSIPRALNAKQAQDYHKREFTSKDQNYWKQGDVNLGEWQGKLAEKFGLSGPVDATQFARLSEGQHPVTGEQLVKHRNGKEYTDAAGVKVNPVEHRAAWDVTFSPPKSVSLTALVGGDERVRQAHGESVTYALEVLERYAQARIGGNNAAETTGRFVIAKFEHDTARPVDGYAAPQLHTHAVIFNMTERDNGNIRALQEIGVFHSQAFVTAVYQAELFYRLRNMGYELETGRSGAPEIKGYSKEYLEASSERSAQVREYLEKNGFQGPAAAQIAAHETRDKKQIASIEDVMAAHYKVAAAHGNQAQTVIAAAADREKSLPLDRITDSGTRASEAVTYAKNRGFEREAVSDERLLMRDALRRGMGDIRYQEIRQNFDQRIADGEFRAVAPTKHATGRSFTTPETIAMERSAVASLKLGQDTTAQIMQAETARELAATRQKMNDGQRNAIEEILTSRDRVHGLQGLAGTGKTTALEVIREGAERAGYAVEGFAPSSRATRQLKDAGISSETLQKFLARGGQEQSAGDPNSRHLYMLDESSLASTRQMRDFLDKIGPQDRVLVIGDTRQHQAVDAGKPFEQMQDAGMRTAKLDQIVRQLPNPELLKAVEHLSNNETAVGIAMLQDQGRVRQIEDRTERIAAIAKDFASRPEHTIVISPDNASRRDINRAVRVELQDNGQVSRDNQLLPTLIPRSELTGADRQWAARYSEGDVVHYNRGSKELGRDSYATVTRVDSDANKLTVRRADGSEITYDPKRLQGVSTYQEISRDFSKGDRIQFTAPNKDLGVANRDLATIERIADGVVTVRMVGQDDRSVTFDSAKWRHFDHGYATTSHSSQSITDERILVNMDTKAHPELINTRFAYVAVSRGSHEVMLYTNDAAALGQRLSHDVTKSSAVDFRQPQPTQSQTQEPNTMATAQQQNTDHFADTRRHMAPIQQELHPEDANKFTWVAETKGQSEASDIQSYKHMYTQQHVHIQNDGQFVNQQKQPISQEAALDRAMGIGNHHADAIQKSVGFEKHVDNGAGISI